MDSKIKGVGREGGAGAKLVASARGRDAKLIRHMRSELLTKMSD
jgi:hypothetical protein